MAKKKYTDEPAKIDLMTYEVSLTSKSEIEKIIKDGKMIRYIFTTEKKAHKLAKELHSDDVVEKQMREMVE